MQIDTRGVMFIEFYLEREEKLERIENSIFFLFPYGRLFGWRSYNQELSSTFCDLTIDPNVFDGIELLITYRSTCQTDTF